MNVMDVAHYVNAGFEIGDVVQAYCGKIYRAREFDENRPVCGVCAHKLHTVYTYLSKEYWDLEDRVQEIFRALELKDQLGQDNWLHHVTIKAIDNATYRPGWYRLEGPIMEDNIFFKKGLW